MDAAKIQDSDTRVVLAVIRGDLTGLQAGLTKLTDGQKEFRVELMDLVDALNELPAQNDRAIRMMEVQMENVRGRLGNLETAGNKQDAVIQKLRDDLDRQKAQSRVTDVLVTAAAGVAAVLIK
jgi:hypothetical protein